MNSSQLMDKQIKGLSSVGSDSSYPNRDELFLDLVNSHLPVHLNEAIAADEAHDSDNAANHHSSYLRGSSVYAVDEAEEAIVPSYDFHPIRPLDSRASISRVLPSADPKSTTSFSQNYKPPDSVESYKGKERETSNMGELLSEIDLVMKKHVGEMLHSLEGVSGRLTQVETRIRTLENSVDDVKVAVGNNNGIADLKIRQLENILDQMQSVVVSIKDDIEAKAPSEKPEPPNHAVVQNSSLQFQPSSPFPPPDTYHHPPPDTFCPPPSLQPPYLPPPPQQLVPPALPQGPPQQPHLSSVPPQPPHLSSVPPPQPPHLSSMLPQPPRLPSLPSQQPHLPSVPSQQPQLPSVPPQQPHLPLVPPQQPHFPSVPPQQSHLLSVPPQQPHLSSVPPQQPHFPSVPPQQPHLSSMPPQQPHLQVPAPQPHLPPPAAPQQPYPTVYPPQSTPNAQSYYGAGAVYDPPSGMYSGGYGGSAVDNYNYGGPKPTQLPTARVLPQALPTASRVEGSSQSGTAAKFPVDDVVDRVSSMGFSREQVRATVQKLTENGQSVELNVVLDKLMNGGEMQNRRGGWFG